MSKCNLLLLFVVVIAVMSAVPSWGAKFRNPPAKSAISDEDFVKLCCEGNTEKVREAIQSRGANVNAKGIVEFIATNYQNSRVRVEATALMAACLSNNPETVRIITQSGADIRTRVDVQYLTEPLIISDRADVLCFASAFSKNPQIINMIIKAGADINSNMEDGMTALLWATMESASSEIIKTLIKAGANVNANTGDRTVLMQASGFSDNPEIISTLIQEGAKVNAKNEKGTTALMWAASWPNKNPEIVNTLIEAGADDVLDINGRSALMYAVESNDNPEIVAALIEAGSFVNIKDKKGNTPLKLAKARTDTEAARKIISLLQQAGAKE